MANAPKVFIHGEAGTTGLQIRERLVGRTDLQLISIDPDKRKDADARAEMLNSADAVILCLPEDVAPYRAKYPFAMVLPIQLALRSLSAMGFNALMGVYKGRSPLYMRELGKSLRALLKQEGKLGVGHALRITRQIASALAAAHEKGIIHRGQFAVKSPSKNAALRPLWKSTGSRGTAPGFVVSYSAK